LPDRLRVRIPVIQARENLFSSINDPGHFKLPGSILALVIPSRGRDQIYYLPNTVYAHHGSMSAIIFMGRLFKRRSISILLLPVIIYTSLLGVFKRPVRR
jgi:hypothetical protein